jgi:CubicO group peptidase (beta-lactamase class C family)
VLAGWFAFLLAGCGAGSNVTTQLPGELTAAQTQAITALVQQQVTSNVTPGIAVGIARGGKIVYTQAFGNRRLAGGGTPNEPVLITTPFALGSMTKEFTTTAILLLAASGQVSLDAPLSTYIPEYVNAPQMTLRQLATMTAGVPANDGPLYEAIITPGATPSQAVLSQRTIAALNAATPTLDFAPGTKMAYANYGMWLLGEVIRRVTGMSYAGFLTQNIFAKVGMTSTYLFNFPPLDNEAEGYAHDYLPDPFVPSPDFPAIYLDAQGGLESTVHDILAWDIALTSGQILSSAQYQTMLTVPGNGTIPTVIGDPNGEILYRDNDGSPTMYGMGWFVPGANYYFHPGGTNGFTSQNANFNDGTSIVILTNQHLNSVPIGDAIPNLAPQIYRILAPGVTTPDAFTILKQLTVPPPTPDPLEE